MPLSKSNNLWNVDRVHKLWLGGDRALLDKGCRALGGTITTELDSEGLPKNPPLESFAENFNINKWNQIRVRIREGLITVWVNGKEGRSRQSDRRLGGTFGFEVHTGRLRLANIRLKQLNEGSEPSPEKTDNTP